MELDVSFKLRIKGSSRSRCEEAALWLARHGWGAALIEEQKEIWDWNENQKPKPYNPPPAKKATPKPVSVKSVKKDK